MLELFWISWFPFVSFKCLRLVSCFACFLIRKHSTLWKRYFYNAIKLYWVCFLALFLNDFIFSMLDEVNYFILIITFILLLFLNITNFMFFLFCLQVSMNYHKQIMWLLQPHKLLVINLHINLMYLADLSSEDQLVRLFRTVSNLV